jgi:hypothetical protein
MSILPTKFSSKILAAVAATSLVATPVIVFADASAPWVNKAVKKKPAVKKAAPRKRARPVARTRAPAPVEQPVVETVQAPVYEAPVPAPQPEVVPVAEAPAPVAPQPAPAAPVAEAKSGSGWLYGLLGAAAVAGLIVAVAGDGSPASP